MLKIEKTVLPSPVQIKQRRTTLKRLTTPDYDFCKDSICTDELTPDNCSCPYKDYYERLRGIEKILGSTYDLFRLKELVEADRESHEAAEKTLEEQNEKT